MSAARKIEVDNSSIFLQGNLQLVFDALYVLGVIDPVLEMDWEQALEQMNEYSDSIQEVIEVVNSFHGDGEELAEVLKKYDHKTLGFLAMEVAREFADFHSREQLH